MEKESMHAESITLDDRSWQGWCFGIDTPPQRWLRAKWQMLQPRRRSHPHISNLALKRGIKIVANP